MNILQVGKYFEPKFGGMETALRELCCGLQSAGHRVKAVVVNHSKCFPEHSNYQKVDIQRLPTLGHFRSIPLVRWDQYFMNPAVQMKWKLAHIHLPNPLALAALSKWPGKKVATIHAYPENHQLLEKLYRRMFERHISQIDVVVFTSETLRNRFVEKGFSWASHAKVVNLGVSDIKLNDSLNQNTIKKNYSGDLLFVGRLVKYKGLPILIKALRDVPKNFQLSIVGDGPEHQSLVRLTNLLGLQSRVNFYGEVTPSELLQIYAQCRVLVLPSINESEAFGLTMVEGLRATKPIISSALQTGVSEVNLAGVTGLQFIPGNVQGLVTAVNRLLGDESLYHRLSENARQHYLDHFTREKMVAGYQEIYDQIFQPKSNHRLKSRVKPAGLDLTL